MKTIEPPKRDFNTEREAHVNKVASEILDLISELSYENQLQVIRNVKMRMAS